MAGLILEFDSTLQSVEALNAAAYRMLSVATCQLGKDGMKLTVRLEPLTSTISEQDLGQQYLALVTDENLRAQISERTEPVRNLILALAFGALAEQASSKV